MQSGSNSPWDVLLSEAHKGDVLEKREIPRQTAAAFWMGLSILTGDDIFLTPLNDILEIFPVPRIAKIPHVKPWLRGMVLCRGEIFPTTDLSGFLKNKETRITKHARILMLPFGDHFCGILVDKVLGLQRMLLSEIQSDKGDQGHRPYEEHLIGIYAEKKLALPIISLKSIVEHHRFKNAVDIKMEVKE